MHNIMMPVNHQCNNALSTRFVFTLLALACVLLSGCMQENKAAPEAANADIHAFGKSGTEPLDRHQTDKHKHHSNPKLAAYSSMSPDAEKIDLKLLHAEKIASNKGLDFVDVAAGLGMLTDDTGVKLEILTRQIDAGIEEKLLSAGIAVRYVSVKYHRISVNVNSAEQLHLLAKMPEVRRLLSEYGGKTRKLGKGLKRLN